MKFQTEFSLSKTGLALIAPIATVVAMGPLTAAAAPRVVATIVPVHSLAAMVMHGAGAPELLLKGGAGPHGYALRPSDARLIRRAEVIFWIGPELEVFLTGALASLGRKAHVVSLSAAKGIARIQQRGNRAGRRGPSLHVDPHIWLDPANAAAMIGAMARTLSALDPANARIYAANGKRARMHLAALDRDLRNSLAPVRGVPYVVFHDAYGYFERRYGLQHIAAITTGPDRSPGARRLRAIRRAMIAGRARCIFSEPGYRPNLAEALRRGTGARHGVLDPLGAGIAPGPNAYATLLRNLARALTGCLSQ